MQSFCVRGTCVPNSDVYTGLLYTHTIASENNRCLALQWNEKAERMKERKKERKKVRKKKERQKERNKKERKK